MLRKIAEYFRQTGFVRAWLFPVWLLLGLARLIILVVPFRRYANFLGCRYGHALWVPLPSPAGVARARAISQVVRLTARHTPWRSNCFPQAMVARLLLRLYGVPHAVYFGALPTGDPARPMSAHAWVSAGRVQVTGGDGFRQFGVLACFVFAGGEGAFCR